MANPRTPQIFLVIAFLGIICAPGPIQTATELARKESPQALNVFRQTPTSSNLRAFEHELEEGSVVARQLRPWVQFAQFTCLKDAGDKALIGREGWLFYKPGFRYLTERAPNAAVTNHALAAMVDFRDQLAQRGIRLLVMPAPNKESIYPERLSRSAPAAEVILSPQTRKLMDGLRNAGVEVVDLFEIFHDAKQRHPAASTPLYLAQDSHWSPAGVELAARSVAQRVVKSGWVQPGTVTYGSKMAPVARMGDIVRMLQVPQIERRTALEHLTCQTVVRMNTQEPYRDDSNSEVLVLGDSFLRIYQQDEPGAAGFIAHLAKELKQPLASVVNDGGASTLVRQELFRRPALLKNKRLVIWEFVERDIRFGTEGWQKVPLPPVAVAVNSRQP
jgi:hypothetical protein